MTPTARDIDILKRTVWGEARGESREGQAGVTWVILHRATLAALYVARRKKPHPLFGDGSVADACLVPFQFSSWNKNDPNRSKMLAVTADDPSFEACCDVVSDVLSGQIPDPVPMATHYCTVGLRPAWGIGLLPFCVIGRHEFYRDVP